MVRDGAQMTQPTTLHNWTFHEYLGCGTWAARCTDVEIGISPDNCDHPKPSFHVADLSKRCRFNIEVPRAVLFELVRRIGYDVTKRGES